MKSFSVPVIFGILGSAILILLGVTVSLARVSSLGHILPGQDQRYDQSLTVQDLKVTQAIEQAMLHDSSLSRQAHQMRIVTTRDHTVHLLGTISSSDDLYTIITLAEKNAGGDKIRNHLHVSEDISQKPIPLEKMAGN